MNPSAGDAAPLLPTLRPLLQALAQTPDFREEATTLLAHLEAGRPPQALAAPARTVLETLLQRQLTDGGGEVGGMDAATGLQGLNAMEARLAAMERLLLAIDEAAQRGDEARLQEALRRTHREAQAVREGEARPRPTPRQNLSLLLASVTRQLREARAANGWPQLAGGLHLSARVLEEAAAASSARHGTWAGAAQLLKSRAQALGTSLTFPRLVSLALDAEATLEAERVEAPGEALPSRAELAGRLRAAIEKAQLLPEASPTPQALHEARARVAALLPPEASPAQEERRALEEAGAVDGPDMLAYRQERALLARMCLDRAAVAQHQVTVAEEEGAPVVAARARAQAETLREFARDIEADPYGTAGPASSSSC